MYEYHNLKTIKLNKQHLGKRQHTHTHALSKTEHQASQFENARAIVEEIIGYAKSNQQDPKAVSTLSHFSEEIFHIGNDELSISLYGNSTNHQSIIRYLDELYSLDETNTEVVITKLKTLLGLISHGCQHEHYCDTASFPIANDSGFWSKPRKQAFYAKYIYPPIFDFIAGFDRSLSIREVGGGFGQLALNLLMNKKTKRKIKHYSFSEYNDKSYYYSQNVLSNITNCNAIKLNICDTKSALFNYKNQPQPDLIIASGILTQNVLNQEEIEPAVNNMLINTYPGSLLIVTGRASCWVNRHWFEQRDLIVHNTCDPMTGHYFYVVEVTPDYLQANVANQSQKTHKTCIIS